MAAECTHCILPSYYYIHTTYLPRLLSLTYPDPDPTNPPSSGNKTDPGLPCGFTSELGWGWCIVREVLWVT